MDEKTTTSEAAASAKTSLDKVRTDLAKATADATATMSGLRTAIVHIRPLGLLSVDAIADAIGRDRNYVDSVWSTYGYTSKGKQTRVPVQGGDDEYEAAVQQLRDAAGCQRDAAIAVGVIRAERDRIVAEVYESKILGPSAIAAAVGIDRNHVLRIARKAKVSPVWRTAGASRNQHSSS